MVGAKKGDGYLSPGRADVHNTPRFARASLIGSQQTHKCLGDDQRADQIHLQLATKIIDWLIPERGGDGNTGVVNQAEQDFILQAIADNGGSLLNRPLISDIEQERRVGLAPFGLQPPGIFTLADASEDMETVLDQDLCDSPSDARGNSCHDDRWHNKNIPPCCYYS